MSNCRCLPCRSVFTIATEGWSGRLPQRMGSCGIGLLFVASFVSLLILMGKISYDSLSLSVGPPAATMFCISKLEQKVPCCWFAQPRNCVDPMLLC